MQQIFPKPDQKKVQAYAKLLLKRGSVIVAIFVFSLVLVYALGVLLFWQNTPMWLRLMLIAFMLVDLAILLPEKPLPIVAKYLPKLWQRRFLVLTWLLTVILLHMTRQPVEAEWIKPQRKLANIKLIGEKVTIENFRFFKRISSVNNSQQKLDTMEWSKRSFDLNQIVGVDLVIQKFGDWQGSAHAMCSFRLKNGRNIAVSVESRRGSESFNALAGLYRYYQLMIIFGDERDLLWSRISSNDSYPMVIYPLDITENQAQQYFKNLAKRANELAKQPEFYHLLHKNCLTTLVNASPQLSEKIEHDYRFSFPGFSHQLLSEIGLIKGDLDRVMKQYEVSKKTPKPNYELDGVVWSHAIRATSSID